MTFRRDIQEAYKRTRRRLFLFDYDGTLADIAPTPLQAAPTPKLLATLERLTSDSHNTVAIITGRPRHRLDDWLGHLPLLFTAEHGLAWRQPGKSWQALEVATDWKPDIRATMERAAAQIPGSLVTEKPAALIWHYRTALHPEDVPGVLSSLTKKLVPLTQTADLHLLHGKKVLEVRPAGVHKGMGVARWLVQGDWDFILAAGDDITDEDIFAALPPTAFTIKIGEGDSLASYRLENPAELLDTLDLLTRHGH